MGIKRPKEKLLPVSQLILKIEDAVAADVYKKNCNAAEAAKTFSTKPVGKGWLHEKWVTEAIKDLQRDNRINPPFPQGTITETKRNSTQDQNGIDLILHTDRGNIYIQVKSSFRGIKKHLKKFGRRQIIICPRKNDKNELDIALLKQELRKRINFYYYIFLPNQ